MSRLGWIIGALAFAAFLAAAVALAFAEWRIVHGAKADDLVHDIEQAEGFRGEPYDDPRGFPTIGYGTKLPLTRVEAGLLLRHRLDIETKCITERWSPWKAASAAVRDALRHAGFVLGCAGLLEFKKALRALANRDYGAARAAFRRSDWYRQDPKRVERVLSGLPE